MHSRRKGGDGIRTHVGQNVTNETDNTSESAGSALAGPLAGTTRKSDSIDPELQRIVDAWPELPTAVRAGILAMVLATLHTG